MTRRVTTYGLDAPDARRHGDRRRARAARPSTPRDGVAAARPRDGSARRPLATLGTLDARRCRAATTCRTRWRRWRSASSSGCRSSGSPTGLREFRGAERRFEVRGEPNGILVVDDYGHHPTEIAAVLAAARTLNRRIVVAFQPHRFTRTAALMDAFGPALARRRSRRADRHLCGRRGADRRASRSTRWRPPSGAA